MVVEAAGPVRGNGEAASPKTPRDATETPAAGPPHLPAARYLDLWEAQLAATAAEGEQGSAGPRARRPA